MNNTNDPIFPDSEQPNDYNSALSNGLGQPYDLSNPYAGYSEPVPPPIEGIKGWLVVVAIGRVLAPLILLYNIFIATIPLYTSGMLEELSNPANTYYSPLWKPLVLFELLGNSLFLVLNVVLLYWFFAKKRNFIPGFIAAIVASLIFNVFDVMLMVKLQSTYAVDLGLDYTSVLIGPVINLLIWVPYILKSQRARNTFVK